MQNEHRKKTYLIQNKNIVLYYISKEELLALLYGKYSKSNDIVTDLKVDLIYFGLLIFYTLKD
jgi:hypothetical protein